MEPYPEKVQTRVATFQRMPVKDLWLFDLCAPYRLVFDRSIEQYLRRRKLGLRQIPHTIESGYEFEADAECTVYNLKHAMHEDLWFSVLPLLTNKNNKAGNVILALLQWSQRQQLIVKVAGNRCKRCEDDSHAHCLVNTALGHCLCCYEAGDQAMGSCDAVHPMHPEPLVPSKKLLIDLVGPGDGNAVEFMSKIGRLATNPYWNALLNIEALEYLLRKRVHWAFRELAAAIDPSLPFDLWEAEETNMLRSLTRRAQINYETVERPPVAGNTVDGDHSSGINYMSDLYSELRSPHRIELELDREMAHEDAWPFGYGIFSEIGK